MSFSVRTNKRRAHLLKFPLCQISGTKTISSQGIKEKANLAFSQFLLRLFSGFRKHRICFCRYPSTLYPGRTGKWESWNCDLHWSPWRILKYLAGIQNWRLSELRVKLICLAALAVQKLPPFVAALKSELSCFDIEKIWKSWQMLNKIYQARSRSLLPPVQTQAARRFAQAHWVQVKAKQAAPLPQFCFLISSQCIQLSEHLTQT